MFGAAGNKGVQDQVDGRYKYILHCPFDYRQPVQRGVYILYELYKRDVAVSAIYELYARDNFYIHTAWP